MDIKELIQYLQYFDEEHHVVVQDENVREKEIAEIRFDGRNCVIETKSD